MAQNASFSHIMYIREEVFFSSFSHVWIRIKKEKKVRKLLFRSYRDLCSSKFNKRTGERKKESAVEKLKCCHIYFREREKERKNAIFTQSNMTRGLLCFDDFPHISSNFFPIFFYSSNINLKGKKYRRKKMGFRTIYESHFLCFHILIGGQKG